jgi:hypothetical protein
MEAVFYYVLDADQNHHDAAGRQAVCRRAPFFAGLNCVSHDDK